MLQENNIEKVFKDAFQDYSPDVSPKVWNAVSSQIAHPVSPLPQPSATVIKTVAAKLSSAGVWIAGGIAATVITVGVLMYEHTEIVEKNSALATPVSPVENPLAITNNAVVSATLTPAISDNHSKVTTSPQQVSNENLKTENNTVVNKTNNLEIATAETSVSNDSNVQLHEPAKASSSNNEANVPNQNQNSAKQEAKEISATSTTNADVDKVAPLILLNSTAGFAPLQVAGLLNKEDLKGDWDFGDGSSLQLNSNSINHQYTKPGSYKMQCSFGETNINKTIDVIGKINTVFSPNGDGINDYLYVEATTLNKFSLKIFDRNGRKMAELTNVNEKWDGRLMNGELAQTGTCFYELTATTESGKEINQRGAVSLFR